MPTLTASSPLLTPEEAAEFLRTKPRTIERWRHAGGGPPFLKIGRRVCYRLSDLEGWLAQQRRAHTRLVVELHDRFPPHVVLRRHSGGIRQCFLAGNIGGQIARKFRMFLDYGHNRIILEPSDTCGDAFDRAFSGLSVRAEGQNYQTFRIRQVLEHSPASEAGLQSDDVITAADGKPAAELTRTEVIEMVERPGDYELTVRRGEQGLKTTLTPRKLV